MDRKYGHTCHIARMNPNHPFLRQGQIIYYNPDDSAYNSDNTQNDNDHVDSSESEQKYDEIIQSTLEHNDDSIPKCYSNSLSNFLTTEMVEVEAPPTRIATSVKLSEMIHIMEGDEEDDRVILESRSSPTTFHYENYGTNDTVHIKTPTPIKTTIIEEGKKFQTLSFRSLIPIKVHNY